jgi:ElaB/YqjD/DUF883 family membrane-anchored ribosome-binding protein
LRNSGQSSSILNSYSGFPSFPSNALDEFNIQQSQRNPTMAESLHSSSDTPNFDTYPSSPPEGQIGQAGAIPSIERTALVERTALEQRGAELGTAAGKVVVMMRQTKESLANLTQTAIYDRISELAETAVARAEELQHATATQARELSHAAQVKAGELGRAAREKSAELARQAKAGYEGAQRRARQTVHDYPVQVAVTAGVIGLLIGISLRLRRANRA